MAKFLIVEIGFWVLLTTITVFGVIGLFDAGYGFYLIKSSGDWFNEEGNRYTFQYADANLVKMWVGVIIWLPFNFSR